MRADKKTACVCFKQGRFTVKRQKLKIDANRFFRGQIKKGLAKPFYGGKSACS